MPRWFSRRLAPAIAGVAILALSACTSNGTASAAADGTCTPPATPTMAPSRVQSTASGSATAPSPVSRRPPSARRSSRNGRPPAP